MRNLVASLFAFFALAACQSTKPAPAPTEGAATWKFDMHQLSQTLATLLPLSSDPIQFNNPNNQMEIEQGITRLAHFSHAIGQMKDKPALDPALGFVAKQFNAEMIEAQRQIHQGNRSYARFLIRNASNYCVSCHTQTDRGPQFNLTSSPVVGLMTPIERANYYFAVRSFDQGLKEFEAAMQGPDIALLPYAGVEEVTLKALAVAIRVKKDPKLAAEIIDRILRSRWAPVYLQLSAMGWKSSLEDWKKHPNGKTIAEARTLLSKGWKRQVETPLSRAGLVEFLRASSVLHELLDQKKEAKAYADILYTAGLVSEALKELDLYNLSGFYYESCVRSNPHSETARNCYVRLEAVEMANYAAFDSVVIPSSVREHLDELKQMALPPGKSWVQ